MSVRPKYSAHALLLLAMALVQLLATACSSPRVHREKADDRAAAIVEEQQVKLWGEAEPFTIEPPADTLRRRLMRHQELPYSGNASWGVARLDPIPHWPEPVTEPREAPSDTEPATHIDLVDALTIGAQNSRTYQERKEDIFRAALSMDLEAFAFDHTFIGAFDGTYTEDQSGSETTRGVVNTVTLGAARTLRTGAELSSRIVFDLVNLLTMDRDSVYGLVADLSVTIPLLRGAGRHVVTEPLTQAERNVMYAMYGFDQFKRTYAVRVASEYLQVLQQADQISNAEDNYERVALSAERARRLAEAGRLPEIQVDQAQQEELRARDRWLSAVASYERALDRFKITLGLPADAYIKLDDMVLAELAEEMEAWIREQEALQVPVDAEAPFSTDALTEQAGFEERIAAPDAIRVAFANRPDLLTALGRVYDAQRAITVAADDLRWRANLTGDASMGSRRGLGAAGQDDARLDPTEGIYTAGLEIEVPWSRRAARNTYRDRFIALERATRAVQELEDQIKSEVRNALRVLVQARETMAIQARSVELAQRRVDSTELFLQAGRAQIRDVLEAQDALISARNALTSAVVTYRVAELELQRDMGVLAVDHRGLWTEYTEWDTRPEQPEQEVQDEDGS